MRSAFLAATVLLVNACAPWQSDPILAELARIEVSPTSVADAGIGVDTELVLAFRNSGSRSAELELSAAALYDELGRIQASSTEVVPDPAALRIEPTSESSWTLYWRPEVAGPTSLKLNFSPKSASWPEQLSIDIEVDVLADYDGDGENHEDAGGADCDDTDASVKPGAIEIWYDGIDQDCDGNDTDADADGFDRSDDCDDARADVNPDQAEVWYDGVDQDCDGNDTDADEDGFASEEAGGDDCNDADPTIRPSTDDGGVVGVDDDCDGLYDEDDAVEGMAVITEVHRAPSSGVPEAAWFEVGNAGSVPLVLDGWSVQTDRFEGTLVAVDEPILLEVDRVVVICGAADQAPEVPCDGEVLDWPVPSPTADKLELQVGDLVVDAVRWNAAWPGAPGVAMSLDPRAFSSTANDAMASWCDATTVWATADELGSPGAVNPRCE